MATHHAIFEQFDRQPAVTDSQFDTNFIGSKVRHEFETFLPEFNIYGSGRCAQPNNDDPTYPSPLSEDYLEWVDLLEAIHDAGEQFVMIEAGAGYGRWSVNAANAIRRHRAHTIKRFKLVGIEADAARFGLMGQHFLDNELDPQQHWLIQNGLSANAGHSFIAMHRERRWAYGERLIHDAQLERMAQQYKTDRFHGPDGNVAAVRISCVTLSSIVAQLPIVDLIDFDLQGEELPVITESIEHLNRQVKRIHIGTHSIEVETGLRKLLKEHGWECLGDYKLGAPSATPFGTVAFLDGIQSWVNPRLVRAESIAGFRKRLEKAGNSLESAQIPAQ